MQLRLIVLAVRSAIAEMQHEYRVANYLKERERKRTESIHGTM